MQKLFKVHKQYYVVAYDEFEAEYIRPDDFDICETKVFEATFVDREWKDVVPFNSDDGRTCSEILADLSEEKH